MKKGIAVISMFVLIMLVSACGAEESTMESKQANGGNTEEKVKEKENLDEEEEAAKEYYEAMFADEETQKAYINDYIHSETQGLYELSAGTVTESDKANSQNPKVIESISGKEDGEEWKAVLVHLDDKNGDLRENIHAYAKDDETFKLFMVLSGNAEDQDMKESYEEMRGRFDTPVPAEVKQRQKEEEGKEASIEVIEETYAAWEDSIDTVWAHYSAVIKNTGNAPAALGALQINFNGTDGSILGTAQMFSATPDVIMPGETAYISESTIMEGASSPDEFKSADINLDFSKTAEEPMMLETDSIKLKEGDPEYGTPYIVTGMVSNPTDQKADDIRISAALFDEAGNFLGVLDGGIEVSLNPGGKAGFQLNYPELPAEIAGKAAEAKVKAYNWSF
ncbi:FxLYD domain-containing protein [Bacillus marinisedimentorum]|uniref:FxLYD domain-containing protein n=1 Tax=Bacillus marinisedimentorum TaxID=1821260 RepID=UPI0008723E99|nr:FxLYD domain-containing protein [Bacillus marinisedimentorum]